MRGFSRVKAATYGLLLAASPLAMTAAMAQDGTLNYSGSNWLDTISVTGTKTEHKVIDQMFGSSVVTLEELETVIQPNDIKDMLTHIPGVEVRQPGQGSAQGITIRGLRDYGRVNVMIDGTRQNWSMEGHNPRGAFYLDPDLVKSVDVVRGPVATIYGSGAIGGVVNFTTKDASDMLLPGQIMGATFKGSWQSVDQTNLYSASAYGSMGGFDLLANFVYRDRDDYKDGGGVTHEDTATEAKAALFKGSYSFGDGQKITASTMIDRDQYVDGTDYTSYLDGDPRCTPYCFIYRSFGDSRRNNEVEADTYRLAYEYKPSQSKLFDLHASGYITNTDRLQTYMFDSSGQNAGDYREVNITTKGFDIHNTSRFNFLSAEHALTFGGDGVMDDKKTVDPFGTGVSGHTPSGTRDLFGGFVQDEISFGSWLDVTLAARYDTYKLQSVPGAFTEISNDGSRLSPKATVGITPLEGIQFFATYAEAYRAPSITEALNDGGSHGTPYVPNPDLEAEIANNWEGGINLKFDGVLMSNDKFRAKAVYFHNEIEDYIGAVDINNGTKRQFQNIAEARITGFELEANYDAEWMFAGVTYSAIRGDNLATNEPLLTIAPDKFTGTLGFRIEDGAGHRITLGARVFVFADQERVPAGADLGESYTLVNLFSDFEVTENVKIGIGVDNLMDVEYTPYLDMDIGDRAGRGRNFKLTGRVKF
jgi:hemoglobin/transferrin/lactoferrin receptor protein